MTRDQATEIISKALHEHFKPADPTEVAQRAVGIAVALDALGLLILAGPHGTAQQDQATLGPRFHPPGEEIADISRAASNTNPPAGGWASTRDRS